MDLIEKIIKAGSEIAQEIREKTLENREQGHSSKTNKDQRSKDSE